MITFITFALALFSCDNAAGPEAAPPAVVPAKQAIIQNVPVSGEAGGYSFSVTVKSPDTGCDQYADWWEVVGADGQLHYRGVLRHSHVNEQPFTRSGGPVPIRANTEVYVRAHMNNSGYGEVVYTGSVEEGFARDTLDAGFAAEVADQEPLPEGCAF